MHNAMPKIIERSAVVTFIVASTLVTSACHLGGQSFDDGKDGLGGVRTQSEHGGSADAGVTTDAAELGVSPAASVSPTEDTGSDELCAEPEDRIVVESITEQRGRVQGRWLRCGGTAVFDGQPLDGLDINADGSWAVLHLDEAGQLQAGGGNGGDSTWVIFNPSEGSDEFGLRLGQPSAEMSFTTSFWNDSTLMRLSPSGGLVTFQGAGDYQLLTEPVWQPDTVAGDAGSPDEVRGTEACAFEEEADWVRELTTSQQVIEYTLGRWVYCSGAVSVAAQDGLEFRADGTWALLRYDEAGVLLWQTDPALSGTWNINDVTGAGGQFEYILHTTAGGLYSGSLGFAENPSLMRTDSSEGQALFARE